MILYGYSPISLLKLKLLWFILGGHGQWFSSWSYSTFFTIHRASRPLWNWKVGVFKINIWFKIKKRLSLEICGYLKYWDHGKLKECTRTNKCLCAVFCTLEIRTVSNMSFFFFPVLDTMRVINFLCRSLWDWALKMAHSNTCHWWLQRSSTKKVRGKYCIVSGFLPL